MRQHFNIYNALLLLTNGPATMQKPEKRSFYASSISALHAYYT